MSLKKTIVGHFKDNVWIEQEDVTLGPLENAAITASWALGDHRSKEPKKMSTDEKIDALSNPLQGSAYVASAELDYQTQYSSWKSTRDSLEKDMQDKYKTFNDQMSKLPPETKTC